MLTEAENELLTRVGPGTKMGEMLREFWTLALRSAALEADGAPRRVRLLGQNFVAFRATDGRVGVLRTRRARTAAPRSRSRATRRTGCAASSTAGRSMSRARSSIARPSRPSGAPNSPRAFLLCIIPCARRAGWSGSISAGARRRRGFSISSSTRRRPIRSCAAPSFTATGSRASRGSSIAPISACCTKARSGRARRGAATTLCRASRAPTRARASNFWRPPTASARRRCASSMTAPSMRASARWCSRTIPSFPASMASRASSSWWCRSTTSGARTGITT